MPEKNPLIVLTGPTAAGKTELSVKLAQRIGGEIISADSMQVYKNMDIGTAKIMPEEMSGVRHHLIDICSPDEEFNIFRFQQYTRDAIEQIYKNRHIPIIAGGTGFYIQSVLYDVEFGVNNNQDNYSCKSDGADKSVRHELEEYVAVNGVQKLHEILAQCDPQAARDIHPNNVKRVIRAIEYFRQTGQPISEHNREQRNHMSPYNFLYLVLTLDRQKLYERIDRRVDKMLENGLVDEVRRIYETYHDRSLVSLQGLGYKEIISYLEGEITLDEAAYILKRDTRHFAKRQLTWFRRERDIVWIEKDKFSSDEDILEHILKLCHNRKIFHL